MHPLNRRDFARLLGGAGAVVATTALGGAGALAQVAKPAVSAGAKPRVVIIGGGPGGGTLAHILKRSSPEIDVSLIEIQKQYTTCFFSNLYLGGLRTLESLTHNYAGLTALGVRMIYDRAVKVDSATKTVELQGGSKVGYDKLVLSPGIDFKYAAIPGYSEAAEAVMPHAYKGGPQAKLLFDQLRAMPDGGTVVLAPPPNPFRCPPGPYERACMIAHYLKTEKPRSKLVIIDPKKAISKQPLFTAAFNELYQGIIDFHLSTDIDDFSLASVDPGTKEILTKSGLKIKADVANIIPPQKAGAIAELAGCTSGDWCPINPENFASTQVADVYVIGDASAAGEMPKSAFSANSQSKSVSNDLEAMLAGKPKYPPRYRNTCWSLLGPDNSVKVGASYTPKGTGVAAVGSFVSKLEDDAKTRAKSYKESVGWYAGIVAEGFNKKVDQI